MSFWNPKKEFAVSYPLDHVRSAILKLPETDPKSYVLQSNIEVLNQINLHQRGGYFDTGYHIDFVLTKISGMETKVVIEISRPSSVIRTWREMTVSSNNMKLLTERFAALLEGRRSPSVPRPAFTKNKIHKVASAFLSIVAFLKILN